MRRTHWLSTNEEGGREGKEEEKRNSMSSEKIPVKPDPAAVDATLGLVVKRVDLPWSK
jgi:hypothetical protein